MAGAVDVVVRFYDVAQVVGWSAGEPKFFYDGASVPARVRRYGRQDLVDAIGIHAENWGFRASVLVDADTFDQNQFEVQFEDGGALRVVSAPNIDKFHIDAMTQRFKNELRSGTTLLEIGSRARSGISRRSMVPEGCRYIGLDISPGPNVDVVGDAHDLRSAIKEPVDFIFSVSTFEHLLMPWRAALEMNAVMKEGGLAFIQSHQAWPLHEEPWDFFRFSANAWRGLFNAHTGFEVLDAGYQFPGAIVSTTAEAGPPTHGLDREPAWLLSACLVRRKGAALVKWEADVSSVYDLHYDHGPTTPG